jgi:hypothetical protein
MKKITTILLLATSYLLLTTQQAHAICQIICPIVVGSTLTLMERYGVDNTISGLWIGGMLVWASIVTIDWIGKWKKHWAIDLVVTVAFYASTILPLYSKKIIGLPTKMIWGVDKTMIGIVLGSLFLYAGDRLYAYIKEKNGAWEIGVFFNFVHRVLDCRIRF